MRVAVINRSDRQAPVLSRRGSLRVRVFPLNDRSRYGRARRWAASGVLASIRDPKSMASAWRAARSTGHQRAFVRCLEVIRFRPDVCYLTDPAVALDCLPLLRIVPSVVTVPPWSGVSTSTKTVEVLRAASIAHCIFDADERELEAVHGVHVERAWAGFDAGAATTLSKPASDPVRLVAAGRLDWRAQVEDVLVAFRSLLDTGVSARLMWYGSGPEWSHAVHARHDLGLSDAVELRRDYALDEVTHELRRAVALVELDLLGALDTIGLMAMSLGVPIVKYAGSPDETLVRDRREGIEVPIGDVDSVAAALSWFAEDAEAASELGTNASSRVREVFDPDRQAAELTRLFKMASTVGPEPPWGRRDGAVRS